jgi:hypothetical protein
MCQGVSNTNNLLSGFYAGLFFYFSPFFEPVPIVTLIVGVGLWTPIVRRLDQMRPRRLNAGGHEDCSMIEQALAATSDSVVDP